MYITSYLLFLLFLFTYSTGHATAEIVELAGFSCSCRRAESTNGEKKKTTSDAKLKTNQRHSYLESVSPILRDYLVKIITTNRRETKKKRIIRARDYLCANRPPSPDPRPGPCPCPKLIWLPPVRARPMPKIKIQHYYHRPYKQLFPRHKKE
jgi:hypothetical protein